MLAALATEVIAAKCMCCSVASDHAMVTMPRLSNSPRSMLNVTALIRLSRKGCCRKRSTATAHDKPTNCSLCHVCSEETEVMR
eukprot:1547285-Amphidinium_carterae.1